MGFAGAYWLVIIFLCTSGNFVGMGLLLRRTTTVPTRSSHTEAHTAFYARVEFNCIHHVGLLVSDVGISLPFYTAVFGFEDVSHLRPHSLPYPGAFLQCGPQQIHLMQLPTTDCTVSMDRPAYPGRDRHVAIEVSMGGVDLIARRLAAHNVTNTLSSSGRKALFCRDPDANGFEFLEMS